MATVPPADQTSPAIYPRSDPLLQPGCVRAETSGRPALRPSAVLAAVGCPGGGTVAVPGLRSVEQVLAAQLAVTLVVLGLAIGGAAPFLQTVRSQEGTR